MSHREASSYQVVARRYRPQTFAEVSGQDHVTRTLRNAIIRKRVGHAYIFTGLRGTGKTSIARIFAKALNCSQLVDADPCQSCFVCREISAGNSLAVREIDGASHNSVDTIRELIDTFRAVPPTGYSYKVYIIDEVHMLSNAAFNALLKSLEEPPPHTIFILATTELQKIPETVLSRCQRFDLRSLSEHEIIQNLQLISNRENLSLDDGVLATLARSSGGSLRDAQSLLERVVAYADGQITEQTVSVVLGTVSRNMLSNLARAILERKPDVALGIRDEAHIYDYALFCREFVQYWRDLLCYKVGASKRGVNHLIDDGLLDQFLLIDIQDLCDIARRGGDDALRSFSPDVAIDALIIRMATREPTEDFLSLVHSVSNSTLQSHKSDELVHKPFSSVQSNVEEQNQRDGIFAMPEAVELIKIFERSVSPILMENLRRVLIVCSGNVGDLLFKGPEFNIKSLNRPAVLQQFTDVLSQNFPGINWRFSFEVVDGVLEESIYGQERKQNTEKLRREREIATNHPLFRELQKVFPGSSIEGE
jgi:DNA polymerase III subunit gamma/tau